MSSNEANKGNSASMSMDAAISYALSGDIKLLKLLERGVIHLLDNNDTMSRDDAINHVVNNVMKDNTVITVLKQKVMMLSKSNIRIDVLNSQNNDNNTTPSVTSSTYPTTTPSLRKIKSSSKSSLQQKTNKSIKKAVKFKGKERKEKRGQLTYNPQFIGGHSTMQLASLPLAPPPAPPPPSSHP